MSAEAALCEVLLPRLSDTMTEGTVTRWLKAEGDAVISGEPIAEIETDKATTELEAPADGTLLRLLVSEGGTTTPGGVVALIGPKGTSLPPIEPPHDTAVANGEVPEPGGPGVSGHGIEPAPEAGRADRAERPGRLRATPLARRLAAAEGVELQSLERGSGPNGRILRQDVERALTAPVETRELGGEVIVPSRLQMAVARRMTAAKRDIPHYYLDAQVDVTRLLELRASARQQASPLDVPLTAYVMRAAALALGDFPRVNASWTDDGIIAHGSIDIGFAVAADEDALLVPVVRHADTKSIAKLAAASAELTDKARDGRLALGDMGGGSFTISNLGMFGVDAFHAIINPPESGILAVGATRAVPAFEDDRVVKRDALHLSLSADHRVYSGATAAKFLNAIRTLLEQPLRLL